MLDKITEVIKLLRHPYAETVHRIKDVGIFKMLFMAIFFAILLSFNWMCLFLSSSPTLKAGKTSDSAKFWYAQIMGVVIKECVWGMIFYYVF